MTAPNVSKELAADLQRIRTALFKVLATWEVANGPLPFGADGSLAEKIAEARRGLIAESMEEARKVLSAPDWCERFLSALDGKERV